MDKKVWRLLTSLLKKIWISHKYINYEWIKISTDAYLQVYQKDSAQRLSYLINSKCCYFLKGNCCSS